MGVPKFYRWISERYPLINQILSDSTLLPEIDNFYLDMNGIIHACTHPNDQEGTSKALTFREMVLSIFGYIDRIVTEIVKPKKLLFMAVDGVAPRAKLNQQRARRFRAAQEREEKMLIARQKGEVIDEENVFDTNAITPGTEFMDKVGKHLRWFIRKKMKEDPIWSNLEVVFSGHDVPGEGEHKIMQYIREARAKPDYPPNLRHCMYGQDADLIMLGLVTHEPHFTLLREVINFNTRFGAKGVRQAIMKQTKEASFQLLHISILREYIELDLGLSVDFAVDKERLIDDFVFLTFLVGNDFLPHLPTLDISEHAFDVIFNAYKELLGRSPGYITENGEIRDFARFEELCAIIGKQEATILKTREEDERSFNSRRRGFGGANAGVSEEEAEEAAEALRRAYEEAYLEAMGVLPGSEEAEEVQEEETAEAGDDEFTPVSRQRQQQQQQQQPGKVLQRAPANWTGGAEESKGGDGDDGEGAIDELAAVITKADAMGNTAATKDYRGQYYFKKFKIIADKSTSSAFLDELMVQYLKGLVWCLAYYVKGCISWTWYYPYHYGPMLIDMKGLADIHSKLSFDIGNPFLPFQQLLGCLPSGSKALLPRPYQWLMTSEHSPILKYYPLDFQVDMDGKRNPWEAVVLLDFIDEKVLLEAERAHCKSELLTAEERRRNTFGTVTAHLFDPTETSTYYSCNPDIGLIDIHQCCTSVMELTPSLLPGAYFTPRLVPGTLTTVAGFPTLTAISMNDLTVDFAKINVFGSASKYRSLVMTVHSRIQNVDASKLGVLVGRSVFVNYPQLHEAKIVAVTTESEEVRQVTADDGSLRVQTTKYDVFEARKWQTESSEMEKQYLMGRGVPGSGGLDIGRVQMRLRLLPLQGMARDPRTGAKTKIFGRTEADVPAQLVLWSTIVEDPRFQEVAELPVASLFPVGCTVVSTTGDMIGCRGVVVGPHAATDGAKGSLRATSGGSTNVSRQTSADSTGTSGSASSRGSKHSSKERVLDVEFTVSPPEPLFGYAIAASVQDTYFPSREVCKVLNMSASLLGKLVGALFVEPIRADIGLNLKRNGQYQLLGYVRRVDPSTVRGTIEFGDPDHAGTVPSAPKAWGSGDTVSIVGSVSAAAAAPSSANNPAAGHTTNTDQWEYSSAAVALLVEYQDRFPALFANLLRLPPGSPRHTLTDLFGKGATEKNVEEVMEWMKSKPFFNLPRTPLTTISMSRDAMQAVERAVDVRQSYLANAALPKVVVKSIPCHHVFRGDLSSPFDAPLELNTQAPRLGDRVVNLNSTGVPCGLKGTVVCIHGSTGFVEVIFDEEFVGGRSLGGCCSQFRGRLCPWSGLLKLHADHMHSKTLQHLKANVAVPGAGSELRVQHKSQHKHENGGAAANAATINVTGQMKKLSVSALLSSAAAASEAKPSENAIKILNRPLGKPVEAPETTTVPAPVPAPVAAPVPVHPAHAHPSPAASRVFANNQELRTDLLEALQSSVDNIQSGANNEQPQIIQRAVSDGSGIAALAAAAGVAEGDGSNNTNIPAVPLFPLTGMNLPVHILQPNASNNANKLGKVPVVAHNQRLPSPTKQRREPSPVKAASASGHHQQQADNKRGANRAAASQPGQPKSILTKQAPPPANNTAATDAADNSNAVKEVSTLRKISLPFSSPAPSAPSVTTGSSEAANTQPSLTSSAPAPTPAAAAGGSNKPQGLMEKLAAAKRTMKKSMEDSKKADANAEGNAQGSAPVDAPITDARKLSVFDLKTRLRDLGVPPENIERMGRWDMVHVVVAVAKGESVQDALSQMARTADAASSAAKQAASAPSSESSSSSSSSSSSASLVAPAAGASSSEGPSASSSSSSSASVPLASAQPAEEVAATSPPAGAGAGAASPNSDNDTGASPPAAAASKPKALLVPSALLKKK